MRTRTTLPAALLAFTVLMVGCDDGGTKSDGIKEDAPKAPAPTSAAPLSAQAAAAELADAIGVKTLGNPTNNTGSCSNQSAGAGRKTDVRDCSQLITTDTVSIYEFPTVEVAEQWTKRRKFDRTWRQVDRFALSWSARDQQRTSKERRSELETALRKLIKS
ncbi:hypothetical protein [Streptomyces sp. NRRL S-920]|uniref:hypothetical protein n=1 Tax=Streptomyces sp. NRRL S-920 TaxID=1463921 RepID=UPI0004C80F19|nr:hypothetical protein [Streptomyces sp. NRRL S-920]